VYFYTNARGAPEDPLNVAAVLRAAPELRTLHGERTFVHLGWRNHPAFAGLVHRNLRSLQFIHLSPRLTDVEYTEFDIK
jgi:hypothetical protein